MKRSFASRGVAAIVFVTAWFLPGCGSSVKLVPVSGKVTVDGQPLTSGNVSLVSTTKEQAVPGLVSGKIDSSGNYKITTGGKDGAPLGKYKVTVNPDTMPTGGDAKAAMTAAFDMKYSNPKDTPLTIEVVESPAAGAYDLKLTK